MGDSKKPLAIFLMGPTASGKTALAVELVRRFACEIISVDSALVYRGMDIGTAKPDAQLLAVAPHRLIDILDPAESYSAAMFREDALAHMADISASGHIPLLVGGTGLYFRALEQGLSELPSADPVVRARLEEEAAQIGWSAMHERLAGIDPESAARIHPNDPQRIERALEVYEISGESMSELYQKQRAEGLPYRLLKFVLMPDDRAQLHRRIEQRFATMMEQGFLVEVKALFDREDLHAELPAMRAVGYRQLWSYLQGECTLDEAVEKGIIATRQYAKRQITWLRAEQNVIRLCSEDENNLQQLLKYLDEGTI